MTPKIIYNLGRLKQISGTAIFSDDKLYRYLLTRQWQDGEKCINWVMCNPSTATETILDPTVTKCLEWSILWGYDQMIVTNIFAYRSTDPIYLSKITDPIGPKNDYYLRTTFEKCRSGVIIAAWSNDGKILNRSRGVLALAKSMGICLNTLKVNQTGEPSHPLYLKKNSYPSKWKDYTNFNETAVNDIQ